MISIIDSSKHMLPTDGKGRLILLNPINPLSCSIATLHQGQSSDWRQAVVASCDLSRQGENTGGLECPIVQPSAKGMSLSLDTEPSV